MSMKRSLAMMGYATLLMPGLALADPPANRCLALMTLGLCTRIPAPSTRRKRQKMDLLESTLIPSLRRLARMHMKGTQTERKTAHRLGKRKNFE
jgi:hypothetical protein